MPLVLYDTAARAKRAFEPMQPGRAGMYVCGPTVYDLAHIGNGRTFLVFDVLYRVLASHYPTVTYVRNITDVDDKINAQAAAEGVTISTVTKRTIAALHEDLAALGLREPDHEPKATSHIGQMLEMIAGLIADGHAYEAEGHVLFDVNSKADYGRLSGRTLDEMVDGARIEVAPFKRDPKDFVLWKPSGPDLPGWDSPYGRGRPGWHIECSAMSRALLGPSFDIHGGGRDLVFPHHENELAQSECANHAPFARYWVHSGFLTVDGEKMSKSLGNFVTIRDALAAGPRDAVRLALLMTHYRQPADWSVELVTRARQATDRWYKVIEKAEEADFRAAREDGPVPAEVAAALDDDLNTPEAIAAMHGIANAAFHDGGDAAFVHAARALRAGGRLMGLLEDEAVRYFRWRPRGLAVDSVRIEALIADRKAARAARNFAEADRIRDLLASEGVVLEDGPQGTSWRLNA